MGEHTAIEWADHTFNPWWGCARVPRLDPVGSACDHCYAATWAARFGVGWGAPAAPRLASESLWRQPLTWNRKAIADGVRRRVFCLSMGDVFERRDNEHGPTLDAQRARLWKLIEDTPGLDWLLLTKRPENVAAMVPPAWLESWPANVWVGTTVACQADADVRIPHLLRVPARVRFLSVEPMLGPVSLRWLAAWVREDGTPTALRCDAAGEDRSRTTDHLDSARRLSWVIVGGESGHGARPMRPAWAWDLRDQCAEAGVPFFFKQWGEHDEHGRNVGKHAAGRLLDGRTWDEVPT